MKNLFGALAFLCLSLNVNAQDQTLADFADVLNVTGVYGGVSIVKHDGHVTDITGFYGVEIGNNFDVMFNTNNVDFQSPLFNNELTLKNRGIGIAYRPFEHLVLHPVAMVSFNRSKITNTLTDVQIEDKFFTLQSNAGLELNALPFMKISLTAGFNVFSKLNNAYPIDDLPRTYGQISFKFGGFSL